MNYIPTPEPQPGRRPGTVCKNCAHGLEGPYCCHCGQSAGTSRIMTGEVLKDAFFSVVQVNRGFLFTVKELSLRPGKAIQDYLAGHRVNYYSPHKYLFFIGAVTSFLTSRFHSFSGEYTSAGTFGGGIDAFLNAFFQYADMYATLVNVVSIPVFALFSLLLFRRSGYNYAEHLVLNAYITAQQLLLFIGWLPLTRFDPLPVHWLPGLYVALTLGYNLWVYVQFSGIRTGAGFARAGVAMVLAYLGQFLVNVLFFKFGGMYL